MEPAPLYVVSGEVPSDPVEALKAALDTEREQRRMLERDIRGKRLQISNLEAQLRDRQATDPGRAGVRQVLEYFSRRAVETGWWSMAPRFEVGDERWKVVSARQKEGRAVAECFVAIEGAFSQDRKRTKRAYVDITSVFRNNANFERAFEHGVDPDLRRAGRHVRIVPPLLLARWDEIESDGDMCDCGHIRYDHDKPKPLEGVYDPPCLVPGCTDCLAGFDDFHARCERWLASRDELARRRMG